MTSKDHTFNISMLVELILMVRLVRCRADVNILMTVSIDIPRIFLTTPPRVMLMYIADVVGIIKKIN